MSNCATNIYLSLATNPSPTETNGSIKQSCSHTKKHVDSHPLEKYCYCRKGHKKTKKNRHRNGKSLAAQMGVDSNAKGVDSNAKGVDSNSKGVDSNPKGVDSNSDSQPLLALLPFYYRVGRCDMSQFLCDPANADERLSWGK